MVARLVEGLILLSVGLLIRGTVSSTLAEPLIFNQACGNRYYEGGFPVDTRVFEHPWLVRFGYQRDDTVTFVFQGLLIHPKFVITTVFVAQFEDLGQLTYARVGEHNNSTDPDCEIEITNEEKCAEKVEDIQIDAVIIHPEYDSIRQINNIALVQLRNPAQVNNVSVAPICLNRDLHPESPFLLIASWCGRRETGLSLIPKQYHMKPITAYECKSLMPTHKLFLTHGMFCIVFDDKHTTQVNPAEEPNLRGGSGAPIYTVQDGNRIVLIGLLSYGARYPAKLHEPYIITPVAPFYDWLTETIRGNLDRASYNLHI